MLGARVVGMKDLDPLGWRVRSTWAAASLIGAQKESKCLPL